MTDPDEDDLLLRQTAEGNVTAYRRLVSRYMDYCVRFAERMLGNRPDAEEVAQDVCVRIWKEASKWQRQAKFSTWLYRVMFNACIDRKRKVVPFPTGGALPETADSSPGPEGALQQKETAGRVIRALQKLPERQRAAVVLSYYEGIENRRAAEAMDIGLGAFQQLLFRARQNLKAELVEDIAEEQNGQEAR